MHTGDVGHIDDDGFLVITDRKKDIIVTAGGKNVAPQNLENDLKVDPVISQVLVVGDRRPYVAALVTLDPDAGAGRGPPTSCSRRSSRPSTASTPTGRATSRSSGSRCCRGSSRSSTTR